MPHNFGCGVSAHEFQLNIVDASSFNCHKVDRAGLWLYQGLWDPLLVPIREGTCKSFADFEHVELVPGGAFGDDKGVRISYVAALSTLQDEIEKIKEATTLLKPRVAV